MNKENNSNNTSNIYTQSIIIPFHKNKDLLYCVLQLLLDTIPPYVEIIIIANNVDKRQIEIEQSSYQVKIYKFHKSMLYSEAMNLGVSYASGEIITMFDQDVFCFGNWYEVLLNKLLSSSAIGAVSPKLINPTNNRIIDFGIAYSPQNILHPMRGLPYNHPDTLADRKVLSACGAVMMTYKSLYQKVGGMDKTMPYICCDCDYGIQLAKEGYETWVVANACVYHKGSSSNKNTKNSEYSYLRGDSKAMFFAKNYTFLTFDMKNYILSACYTYRKKHLLSHNYYFYNLCSLQDSAFFIDAIQNGLNVQYYDIYTINITCRNPMHLQLYDYLQYLQIPQNSFFIKISSEDNNFCDPLVLSEIINEIRHFMGYHLNTFKQRSIFSIIDETYDDYTTPPTCNYIKDYKIGKNTLSPHSLLYKKHYSIYLAAPFTSIANSEDKSVPEQQDYYQQLLIPSQRKHGTLPVKYQRILERIRKQIANSWNVDVILPHKDVNAWGKNELSSDIVLAKIVENINSCHGIVAIPSTSIGVHLEIGIAIAQQKPIIIFDIDELENSFYVSNFNVLNNIRTCHAAKISDIPKIINSHEELKDFMFSKGEIIL